MKTLYDAIVNREEKIAIVGLGYVGLPIAHAFSKKALVLGFDINEHKINEYVSGVDSTREIGDDAIRTTSIDFTFDANRLREARFIIAAVPTPVKDDHTPDLRPVISASKMIGQKMSPGTIVVYESTVYPGVTEEICVPILEEESGLVCGKDFFVGYSPERINPGDKVHRLENIVKIVSGMNSETLDVIAKVYELVVEVGVYKAESIKVAEAAKVIENSQRDINIAFMNELSIIFNKMNIDTQAVLQAAGTKWNFLNFTPGLVGGHCIGVDPYYLTYKAEQLGYHSQIILSGRRINDNVGKYITENVIKSLVKADVNIKSSKVAILGFTFKEDCPDTRNTKVIDIIDELKQYGVDPIIVDPIGDTNDALNEYGVIFKPLSDVSEMDAVIIAVSHAEFKALSPEQINAFFKHDASNQQRVLIDVKAILNRKEYEMAGYQYWRL